MDKLPKKKWRDTTRRDCKGTELHLGGGDSAQKKTYTGRRGQPTYFVDRENNLTGDTAQQKLSCGSVVGWSKLEKNAILWLHLAS